MIEIYNFDLFEPSGISYGGHGGSKKGVIINNEKWFLKYPKSTKSMKVKNLSYTTTPLSEYIGSKIYKSLGFETHKTLLGIANNKVVVACKDFLNANEVILDYNSIKNAYDENVEKAIEELASTSSLAGGTDLEEILLIMENNPYFKSNPELKNRFWDMFIVDAFINNNDRNEGNWGLVLDREQKKTRIAPVFDNGASFYNKSDDEKLNSIYFDEYKFKQSIYDSAISIFRKNGKIINPLKFIESMENEDCNKALLRIFPKINLEIIEDIINDIPEKYNDFIIFSNIQKLVYFKSLKYKYENVFVNTYNKLNKTNN